MLDSRIYDFPFIFGQTHRYSRCFCLTLWNLWPANAFFHFLESLTIEALTAVFGETTGGSSNTVTLTPVVFAFGMRPAITPLGFWVSVQIENFNLALPNGLPAKHFMDSMVITMTFFSVDSLFAITRFIVWYICNTSIRISQHILRNTFIIIRKLLIIIII